LDFNKIAEDRQKFDPAGHYYKINREQGEVINSYVYGIIHFLIETCLIFILIRKLELIYSILYIGSRDD